jgi:uncharacterized protein
VSRKTPLAFSAEEIRERQGLAVSVSVPGGTLFPEPPAEARLDGPVEASLEFSVGGDALLMQARLSGRWTVPCSRCLAEHTVAFDARAEETYPLSTPEIDVTEDLRQAALLEVPARSLCRPDCRGLCPRCGKDLNAGPCGCAPEMPKPLSCLKDLKKGKRK